MLYTLPGGGLFAAPFDLDTHQITGTLRSRVGRRRLRRNWEGVLGVSQWHPRRHAGVDHGGPQTNRLLAGDRAGSRDTLRLSERPIVGARLSPDGRSVTFVAVAEQGRQVFIYDVETNASPQLTFEGPSVSPVWSPDGSRIAYGGLGRDSDVDSEVYVKSVDERIPERRVVSMPGSQLPTAWTTDDLLVFTSRDGANADIFTVSPSGDGDPVPYLQADFSEYGPVVSPDGTLGAYTSNEASDVDVYVRAFPDPVGQWRVSSNEGQGSRWSPDGGAMYYWVRSAP